MKLYYRILIIWIALLIGAFACTYLLSEPYPTFVMPGFARIYQHQQDTLQFDEPVITLTTQHGQYTIPNYQVLWNNLHYTSPPAVMKQLFTHSVMVRTATDSTAPTLYQWLKQRRVRLQEQFSAVLRPTTPDQRFHDTATVAWLYAQMLSATAQTLHQHDTVQSATIRWYRTYSILKHDSLCRVNRLCVDSLFFSFH